MDPWQHLTFKRLHRVNFTNIFCSAFLNEWMNKTFIWSKVQYFYSVYYVFTAFPCLIKYRESMLNKELLHAPFCLILKMEQFLTYGWVWWYWHWETEKLVSSKNLSVKCWWNWAKVYWDCFLWSISPTHLFKVQFRWRTEFGIISFTNLTSPKFISTHN